MAPSSNFEFLTATRYYFNTDKITEKLIQKIESANVETPATEQVQGSGKGGILQRQAAPTAAKMGSIKLTLALSKDKAIYDWYAQCNKNNNEANRVVYEWPPEWDDHRLRSGAATRRRMDFCQLLSHKLYASRLCGWGE